ncbi:IATP ATPase inhibitor [Pyrrhoderma noxium]|uniref:IATP ATPase inhibitor n=1 Tax=Pyrrhoderma noxium TaxID=2282107 RepID=A0A286UVH1_9AGAM|nr:IATP ATPase inhibitor [Pyrrhoderma noxium]
MSNPSDQNKAWKLKEQGDENQYAQRKDQELLATLRAQMERDAKEAASRTDKDFEGGYGGQEDLEDRYATTSGEH